ncbi:hypothetical protein MANES_16G093766v8 [Manihot esculenta]|uniref:Uncharacterized protein n=1 Tax=Manihot esculenta TaxID=3983 RepID=A0ACB7G7J3_MANES|nr:hypothetical protein MANES_16G093766v8 [Manihot esculenta]
MVLSRITISLSQPIAKNLQDRFSQEEMYSFKQGDLSVTDYLTRMKLLWDELDNFRPIPQCTYANPYKIRFLKGLNDQFSYVRSQIMLIDPLPSINKVFSLVVQQERQLFLGVVPEPTALVTKLYPKTFQKDLMCITPLRSVSTVASQDIQKKLAIGSIQYQRLLALIQLDKQESHSTNQISSIIDHNSLHLPISSLNSLDTGATDDVCFSFNLFLTYKKIKFINVNLPNGVTVPADMSGKIYFSNSFTLSDENNTSKRIGLAEARNGLYLLVDPATSSTPIIPTVLTSPHCPSYTKFDIWHFRLGHPFMSIMNVIQNKYSFSPYEVLYHVIPDLSFLSLCFATIITASRIKFDPRARRCIFLDYKNGTKGLPLQLTEISSAIPKTCILYPISQVLTYEHLSPSHRNFILSTSIVTEPKSYSQAVKIDCWKECCSGAK